MCVLLGILFGLIVILFEIIIAICLFAVIVMGIAWFIGLITGKDNWATKLFERDDF